MYVLSGILPFSTGERKQLSSQLCYEHPKRYGEPQPKLAPSHQSRAGRERAGSGRGQATRAVRPRAQRSRRRGLTGFSDLGPPAVIFIILDLSIVKQENASNCGFSNFGDATLETTAGGAEAQKARRRLAWEPGLCGS